MVRCIRHVQQLNKANSLLLLCSRMTIAIATDRTHGRTLPLVLRFFSLFFFAEFPHFISEGSFSHLRFTSVCRIHSMLGRPQRVMGPILLFSIFTIAVRLNAAREFHYFIFFLTQH